VPDFAAISNESIIALAEAEAAGASQAAAFLRVRVPQLLRAARLGHDCRDCEYLPHDPPITRRHEHA
jgi:hypothetical protein